MTKIFKFPKGFWWGSSTSAEQIEPSGNEPEAGKSKTIWNATFDDYHHRIFDGEYAQNNFYVKYKEDLQRAKDLNFNSIKLSFSWARIMPDGKSINEEGVEFYDNLLDECDKLGIVPFLELYHFDMPLWAQEMGGWTSDEVIEYFLEYAKFIFNRYGDRTPYWSAWNEPIVLVECQYWYQFHYPFEVNFQKGIKSMMNINKIHCLVTKILKDINPDYKMGIYLNITPAIPRSDSPEDLQAAKFAEMIQWRSFADPLIKGKFPQELYNHLKANGAWPEDIDIDEYNKLFEESQKLDFMGINYYTTLRVKAPEGEIDWSDKEKVLPNTHLFNDYKKEGIRMNPYRGWEVHPKSIYDMLTTLKEEYNNIPCFIAENGMGVENEDRFRNEKGFIEDDYRIDFINEHLYWVWKAIEEGSSCSGYHMWSYIDNWSWLNSYKNRYGFYELDLKTNERKPKKSASWIKGVIKNNSIEIDEEKIQL